MHVPIPTDWSSQLQVFVKDWKAKWQDQNFREDRYWGDEPFAAFIVIDHAASWNDFLDWLGELRGSWGFRGQREASWLLHTSLDRAVLRKYSKTHGSIVTTGHYHLDREIEGRDLLFRFQQQAHQYLRHLPARDDLSSWFALMQHHGVPTRLLDWTLSPYVGMYFAIEDDAPQENDKNHCFALWGIDLGWLEVKGEQLLVRKEPAPMPPGAAAKAACVNKLLSQSDEAIIIKVDPLETDDRMSAQQGFFLCKLKHPVTFNQALMRMMMDPETVERPVVRKLEVDAKCRIDFLKILRRMNIHRASLFPGLDGFGHMLKLDLEIRAKGEDEP